MIRVVVHVELEEGLEYSVSGERNSPSKATKAHGLVGDGDAADAEAIDPAEFVILGDAFARPVPTDDALCALPAA